MLIRAAIVIRKEIILFDLDQEYNATSQSPAAVNKTCSETVMPAFYPTKANASKQRLKKLNIRWPTNSFLS